MTFSIEAIEDILRTKFRKQVLEPGIQDPVQFLHRWMYLSSQVSRLHGAALARTRIPEIQCLLAEIAFGECGFGNREQIHSKLLLHLMHQSPQAAIITQKVDAGLEQWFEDIILNVSHMTQDEAIGFIVGLEAPAYDILHLLKQALMATGLPEAKVAHSDYMVIHNAVEKDHQESGHAAMEIIFNHGCDVSHIYKGGNEAIQFLIHLVGASLKAVQVA